MPGSHPETKPELTIEDLQAEAGAFAHAESQHKEPSIYGVDNGKSLGTYVEHKFRSHLAGKYSFEYGSSAKGIDFPALGVDLKVTSVTQPQSSCPYRSARQKVYGLGYGLLLFVYEKTDDHNARTGTLSILHCVFVDAHRTGDYQTSRGLREILERDGNAEDLIAFMRDRNLPVDDIQANEIAEELLANPPLQGYLTISNALQWRLQYGRVIASAGSVDGVASLRG